MGFLKTADAALMNPISSPQGWGRMRTASGATPNPADLIAQASEILGARFDPDKYLLTHCTIVASVDVEDAPNTKTGNFSFPTGNIVRKWTDYLIVPETDRWVNNNNDSFERKALLKAYPTFIGAHNFLEHVQLEELSKGRVIDAAARDIGDSLYVDILVATDKAHRELIASIRNKELGTLSMGCSIDFSVCTKCGHVAADEPAMCFPPDTMVLMADGSYLAIEEVVPGDVVVTHLGNSKQVTETLSRNYSGTLKVLEIEGVPTKICSTPEHPYWVLRPQNICACGCGSALRRTVEHQRGSAKAFTRRFLPGHNSRVWNPNPQHDNVVPFEQYQKIFELSFDFAQAKELKKGDYLAFPIPQEVRSSPEISEAKATLIGRFLAEGSFIKRNGEKVGVSFSFGHHEKETLARDTKRLLDQEFGLLNRHAGNAGNLSWQKLLQSSQCKPIRRRKTSNPVPEDLTCPRCTSPPQYLYNAGTYKRKKGGPKYNCKLCQLTWCEDADRSVQARVYDSPVERVEDTGSCNVNFLSKKVATFFFKYAGEYSHGKQLEESLLYLEPELQRNILFGWLHGDATQVEHVIRGDSVSFKLIGQMQILAARCGYYARRSIVFGGKKASVQEVVNSDGTVSVRDARGWLPLTSLTLSSVPDIAQDIRFDTPESAAVKLRSITEGFHRVGNWLIHRIKNVYEKEYQGSVHNLEVAGDHSYVVEGVAVHNCRHIRFEKGNYWYDDLGKKRRIAELCGHHTVEPHAGIHYMDASWVKVPAFTGAVLRSILEAKELSPNMARKVAERLGMPAPVAQEIGMQKAAYIQKMGGPFDDPGEEGAAETEEVAPIQDLEDEVVKLILDRAKKRIKDELTPQEDQGTESIGAPAETIFREANRASREEIYRAGLLSLARVASSDIELINSTALYEKSLGHDLPFELYRASLKIGPYDRYKSATAFFEACKRVMGRQPNHQEATTMLRLGKLLSLRRRF